MKLVILLDGFVEDLSSINSTIAISGITLDSRKVQPNNAFIGLMGTAAHGLKYAEQAQNQGATVLFYDPQEVDDIDFHRLTLYPVAITELKHKLGEIADRFYHSPSSQLDIIGITGTNGKTSCSQFLQQVMPASGVIGTLGWGEVDHLTPTLNTTPDPVTIQGILADFVQHKKQSAFLEVSSHGLTQDRLANIHLQGAVLTNITRDHLDYHGSMEAYLQAKLKLFKQSGLQYAVINMDAAYRDCFFAELGQSVKCWAYSISGQCHPTAENVLADNIHDDLDGLRFDVSWRQETRPLTTQVTGYFNVENILAVICVLLAQGLSLSVAVERLAQLNPVLGRMEHFGGGQYPHIWVDYAHTPDALEKVLQQLSRYKQGKLILVFGCGGERDAGKRVQMGSIAQKYADHLIITNDNPRSEPAEQIIAAIKQGCSGMTYQVIQDREQAISVSINQAKPGDCVLIAGKGHEQYQEIAGVRFAFSDQAVVRHLLAID